MIKKKFAAKASVFFFLGSVLSLVTRTSPPPERSQSLIYALPTFLVFLLFVVALCAWGGWIRRVVLFSPENGTEQGLFDLTAGTLFAYLMSYFLTPFGLFSSKYSFFLWGILSVGFGLGSDSIRLRKWFDLESFQVQVDLLKLLPPFIIFLKLLEGIRFHQSGDPYIAYLGGPRSWASLGNFSQYLKFTPFFLTSSWESLSAWGTALMGLEGGGGLDLSQWFSQWVTSGVGLVGIVLGLMAIGKRFLKEFSEVQSFLPVAIVAGIQLPVIRWTANLAKNDIGVAFWGVALYFFVSFSIGSHRGKRDPVLQSRLDPSSVGGWGLSPGLSFQRSELQSGFDIGILLMTSILAGSMVIGKLPLITLGGLLCVQAALKSQRAFYLIGVGGVLGVLPVVTRNFSLTGNPLFPWMSEFFGTAHLLGISERLGSQSATQFGIRLSEVIPFLEEWVRTIPFLILGMPLFLFKSGRKSALAFFLVPFLSLIVFTFTLRSMTEIRYQGATLILLTFLGCLFTFAWLGQVYRPVRVSLQWAIVIGVLACANISFFTLGQIWGNRYSAWPEQAQSLTGTGGPEKLWIRKNLDSQKSILVMGDGYPYYLLDYPVTNYSQHQNLEELIIQDNLDALDLEVQRVPFDYLYLSRDSDYFKYRGTLGRLLERTALWDSSCQRMKHPTSQIWDLDCLKKKSKALQSDQT